MQFIHFIILIPVLLTSCATKQLWEDTETPEYAEMDATLMSEEELKEKGVEYYIADDGNYYYIRTSGVEKLRNYTFRTLATPFTVTIDAVTVVFIGAIAVSNFLPLLQL